MGTYVWDGGCDSAFNLANESTRYIVTPSGDAAMPRLPNLFSVLARLLMIAAMLVGTTSLAFAEHGADAYVIFAGASDQILPRHAKAGSGYQVNVNEHALAHAHVTFNLGGGLSRVARRTRIVDNDRGRSWIGKFEGVPGGVVIVSRRKGIVSGILDDGENLFELTPGRGGRALLFRVDESKLPPVAAPLDSSESYSHESGSSQTLQSSGIIQDVMLLYTTAVKSNYGSVAATEAALLDSMVATNQAYIDSQIDVQVNVVHIAEVTYNETGYMSTSLVDLRTMSDGHMDEIHAWRNTYGADLVQLVTMDTDNCGVAYLMNNNNIAFATYAFSVTGKDCVSGATPAHEIGHNQGICHNREEPSCNNPAYDYSYGLCGSTFRTIMSYSSPCGTERVRHFSNPGVYVDGQPTGIDHGIDPTSSAEGARTVNSTAATVAAYRSGPNSMPPVAPSNLTATPSSENSITLQWTDNSDDELGFRVERSLDGSSWLAMANLGADREIFTNGALSPGTLYYFRVRAFNSVGSSAWITASAATPSSPQQAPDAPVPLIGTPVSSRQIDLNWTDVSNENGYRVERSDDGENFSLLATTEADITGYDDTGGQPDTLYYYRVTAFNVGGDSDRASTSARTLQDSSQELEYALGDMNVHGTVYSDYTATWYDDGNIQQILEVVSGGKKRDRTSHLDHRWEFDLNSATSAMVSAIAWKSGSGVDEFVFEYSTDGSNFSPLFTVSETASQGSTLMHAAPLPQGLSGSVYLRVKDTDRSPGRTVRDSIHVDQLVIQVENGPVILPIAPSEMRSTDVTATTIRLAWNDNSNNESGFTIERNTDGSNVYPWTDTVGPDSETYDDHSVSAQTLYYYRVNAFNGAGSSAATGTIAVTTPAGGIDLTATGSKRRGRNVIELSWAGAAGETMEIYRNGSVIDSASGANYTDVTGEHGSRTYTYRVCRMGTIDCSDTEQVVF